ncbi:hypothetical protein EP51_29640 [Rhodococcus opacus]|uniref:Uncharacterized protein n=1 Tax=Rhodococcus opacus TaxID=37919 RepID=A0A076ERL1_RHOOP|nr:hypothetical protein EP51_29640 [Rhodococcus opacus]
MYGMTDAPRVWGVRRRVEVLGVRPGTADDASGLLALEALERRCGQVEYSAEHRSSQCRNRVGCVSELVLKHAVLVDEGTDVRG